MEQANNNDFDPETEIKHYDQVKVEAFCKLLRESKSHIDVNLYEDLLNCSKHRNWVRIDMLLGKLQVKNMNEYLNELYLSCPR